MCQAQRLGPTPRVGGTQGWFPVVGLAPLFCSPDVQQAYQDATHAGMHQHTRMDQHTRLYSRGHQNRHHAHAIACSMAMWARAWHNTAGMAHVAHQKSHATPRVVAQALLGSTPTPLLRQPLWPCNPQRQEALEVNACLNLERPHQALKSNAFLDFGRPASGPGARCMPGLRKARIRYSLGFSPSSAGPPSPAPPATLNMDSACLRSSRSFAAAMSRLAMRCSVCHSKSSAV